MRQILKYGLLPITRYIDMPKGAIIRHVGVQRKRICLWVETKTGQQDTEERHIRVVATGEKFLIGGKDIYLGTAILDNGNLVLHIYEETKS